MADPFQKPLQTVATITLQTTLARVVPFSSLAAVVPPNWLFTSGKRNRFNPRDVHCLYMADCETTAMLEYHGPLVGLPAGRQPVVTFWAEVQLRHVLDLTDRTVVKALGLTQHDLEVPWQRTKASVKTQLLGKAVVVHTHIAAIRYPSVAAKRAGSTGINVAVFRDRVVAPDGVRILGPDKKPLMSWP